MSLLRSALSSFAEHRFDQSRRTRVAYSLAAASRTEKSTADTSSSPSISVHSPCRDSCGIMSASPQLAQILRRGSRRTKHTKRPGDRRGALLFCSPSALNQPPVAYSNTTCRRHHARHSRTVLHAQGRSAALSLPSRLTIPRDSALQLRACERLARSVLPSPASGRPL